MTENIFCCLRSEIHKNARLKPAPRENTQLGTLGEDQVSLLDGAHSKSHTRGTKV